MAVLDTATVFGRQIVFRPLVRVASMSDLFTFRYFGGPIPASESFVFTEGFAGTTITYQLNLELDGDWKILATRLRTRCDRTLTAWLRALQRRLEAVPSGERNPATGEARPTQLPLLPE